MLGRNRSFTRSLFVPAPFFCFPPSMLNHQFSYKCVKLCILRAPTISLPSPSARPLPRRLRKCCRALHTFHGPRAGRLSAPPPATGLPQFSLSTRGCMTGTRHRHTPRLGSRLDKVGRRSGGGQIEKLVKRLPHHLYRKLHSWLLGEPVVVIWNKHLESLL